MQARISSFLLVVTGFITLSAHVQADPPVTFEILGNFVYPNQPFTEPNAINENGDVAGVYNDQTSGGFLGFVRYSNGTFSTPIVDPNDGLRYTWVSGVSESSLCGFYERSDQHFHGFVLSGDTFTDVVVPGGLDTFLLGINDAGNLCGSGGSGAFVSIDGVVTSFSVPGANYTSVAGINNLNVCVGSYNSGGLSYHGYRRDADGGLQYPVDTPRTLSTSLNGINDKGEMVGDALTHNGIHGVFFRTAGKAALFDYPGASVTYFTGINNRGLICGYYQTATNQTSRGFVVRVRPATE
jgi:hypothetical protein